MKNWKEKLYRFMQGRYGIDTLYYALNWLWLLLWLAAVITRVQILSLLAVVTVVWMFYRALSKNHTRRRAENAAFLRLFNPVKSFFKLLWARVRDFSHHVYRRCPDCGATLRLPHRRGTHTAVCPRCGRRFDVKIVL